MDTKWIKAYYKARGLQWADQKSALLFFLSEVGELAEAYAEVEGADLDGEERDLMDRFAALGLEADEIVSRKPGWIRNNDRLRKQNIAHEAADCNMMLSVFMESYAKLSPDTALREKMALKLGCNLDELEPFLGIE
jgi:NTP pyrophosphatase (non-canonical NTP hydrolase)